MKGHKVTKDELVEDYKRVRNKLGYPPSKREYDIEGEYSLKPVRRIFGSWSKFVEYMGDVVQRGGSYGSIVKVPNIYIRLWNDPPEVRSDKVVIACDVHSPYYDHELIGEMVEFSKKQDIKHLVIAGDLFDHEALYQKDIQTTQISWVKGIEITKELITDLEKYYDSIIVIMGNHDWRLVRKLQNSEHAEELIDLIFKDNGKTKFSPYHYCYINDWLYVNHPDKGRKTPLSLPRELANIYLGSIINAHVHRFYFGIHPNGRDIIGEGLHMSIAEAHRYKNVRLTCNAEWVQGFWTVIDNKVYPYAKHDKIHNPLGVRDGRD